MRKPAVNILKKSHDYGQTNYTGIIIDNEHGEIRRCNELVLGEYKNLSVFGKLT